MAQITPAFTHIEGKCVDLINAVIVSARGRDLEPGYMYEQLRDLCNAKQQREWFGRTSSVEWWNMIRACLYEAEYTPYVSHPYMWYARYKDAIHGE